MVDGLEQLSSLPWQRGYLDGAGRLLVLDAAPEDGLRSCEVSEKGGAALDPSFVNWVTDVTARRLYASVDGVLASVEWIEPQVHVEAFVWNGGATYRVLETDLES